MKTLTSLLIVVLAGLTGLLLVYTDRIPIPVGPARVAFGGVVYLAAGALLARRHAAGRPLAWALASCWGPLIVGVVGTWISSTDPASRDWQLALTCLVGPLAAAWIGARLATGRRAPA